MDSHAFSVRLRDLDDGPRRLQSPLPDAWMKHQLEDTDVEPAGSDDGTLDVTLTKNGAEVLVRGSIEASIAVPCARTLEPAVYRIRPEVFLILSPGRAATPDPTGSRSAEPRAPEKSHRTRKEKKASHPRGHRGGWEEDPILTAEDAAQDTYSGDQVVLDQFLREFILLEVPMMPLREDLRDQPNEANPALPEGPEGSGVSADSAEDRPLDPRLSPLAEIKARLEKKE